MTFGKGTMWLAVASEIIYSFLMMGEMSRIEAETYTRAHRGMRALQQLGHDAMKRQWQVFAHDYLLALGDCANWKSQYLSRGGFRLWTVDRKVPSLS